MEKKSLTNVFLVFARVDVVLIFSYNIHQVTKHTSHRAPSNSNSLNVHPPLWRQTESQCRKQSLLVIGNHWR